MQFRLAYFGLPLGALLLLEDGYRLDPCVLAPVPAPGLHRLRRRLGSQLLEANLLGKQLLEREIEKRLEATPPPDLLVSWFWTRRLPPTWLELPRRGAIGVHPSLLPRHRGRNPYFWAIDAGDIESGVTVHYLEADYDTGAILAQERLPIAGRNAWQLARALDRPSLRQLRATVRAFARGLPLIATPQDPRDVTQAPEPDGPLLRADFGWPTERVLRRTRALSPVPGVALELAGLAFFVTAAQSFDGFVRALAPGEAQIVEGRLVLRTGDGAIQVERAARVAEDDRVEDLAGEELAAMLAERLESRSRP